MLLLSILLIFLLLYIPFYKIYTLYESNNKFKNEIILYRNLKYIRSILDESKKLAFKKILLEDLMILWGKNERVNLDNMEQLSKKFSKHTLLFLGEYNLNTLLKIFTIEELMANIITDFQLSILDEDMKNYEETARKTFQLCSEEGGNNGQ